jgi:hypothetical protein
LELADEDLRRRKSHSPSPRRRSAGKQVLSVLINPGGGGGGVKLPGDVQLPTGDGEGKAADSTPEQDAASQISSVEAGKEKEKEKKETKSILRRLVAFAHFLFHFFNPRFLFFFFFSFLSFFFFLAPSAHTLEFCSRMHTCIPQVSGAAAAVVTMPSSCNGSGAAYHTF